MVVAFVAVSVVVLVCALVAILRVDQSWTRQVRQCCRCLHTWSSVDKMCPRCVTARGRLARHGLIEARPAHGHDWQGHMVTGPIPVVRAGGVR